MDFSEKWGNDVETATELALSELKASKEEVTITVTEEPSKGFFGIGSKLAKVRVERKSAKDIADEKKKQEVLKAEEKVKQEALKAEQRIIKEEPKQNARERKEEKEDVKEKLPSRDFSLNKERPADLCAANDSAAVAFLKETIEKMGLELEVTAEANEEQIFINIEGAGSGTIIGKRGQTLDAIQYLTSLVVNRGEEKYKRVVVDAENYRGKREKTLEELAERLATKVIKTRRSVRLEPMNPYERMVIHATLHDSPEVATKSDGEEPYRRVIITLK